MDFFDAVEARASVRSFEPCEISQQALEQIVDAGRRAPSGMNRQPTQFIVVQDAELLRELGEIQDCIAGASAAIAVVVDEAATKFWKEDASAAIENMLLAVVALGYGAVWVEGYVLAKEDYGRQVLGIPESLRLLAVLPIGEPSGEVRQADKKPLAEVTHRDRFGQPWQG